MTLFQRISIVGGLVVALLSTCTLSSLAQDKNSTFVHGFRGDRSSLKKVASELNNDFQIDPRRIEYPSLGSSIPNIASNSYGEVQRDAAVVAHSMGGLVSRSMVNQFGTSRVDALVTMGTPHNGVRGATTVPQGAAGALIKHWLNDLKLGWVALGAGAAGNAVANRVLDIVENLINTTIASDFDTRATKDMQPTSSFLDNLNSNFSGTTPDATYAVAGLEDWNSHWRLAGALDDDREGNAIYIAKAAKYTWLSASFYLGYLANRYFRLYQKTGEWIYYDKYLYYANASQAFFVGFDSLHRQQQLEWAWNITGAWNGPGTPLQRSDGLVSYTSQVPSPLRGDQELRALSANHFELKARNNAINRVKQAFRNIGVQKANQPPSASFTYNKVGLGVDFSSNSSDVDGTIVSYAWSFGDGSTSTAANPSHYYSSDGTYPVTLTVTDDDGVTASTTNYVSVGSSDCYPVPCKELK
jgi:pimeloyl-ACP methyl ester carboxylesterase